MVRNETGYCSTGNKVGSPSRLMRQGQPEDGRGSLEFLRAGKKGCIRHMCGVGAGSWLVVWREALVLLSYLVRGRLWVVGMACGISSIPQECVLLYQPQPQAEEWGTGQGLS